MCLTDLIKKSIAHIAEVQQMAWHRVKHRAVRYYTIIGERVIQQHQGTKNQRKICFRTSIISGQVRNSAECESVAVTISCLLLSMIPVPLHISLTSEERRDPSDKVTARKSEDRLFETRLHRKSSWYMDLMRVKYEIESNISAMEEV
ncbi:hypothetical protein AVEN_118353-1 [Araneus ventricosus]|uniref:Uncharacterized protein n=1 Tax=Araneus ventricosus TaxID=182803 RepID=A0A4Y2B5C3_ARAVE|nr:hypothetical protein AVEN_118353-1 [Araneus ventricosus]